MKVTIYPRNLDNGSTQVNPYIKDFVSALEQEGIVVANPPHKNPLFSLIGRKTDSDAYIFHWLENVPDYKYGMLQTLAALWLLITIKFNRKRIIWFLHNKQPHVARHQWAKKLLTHLLISKSDLIVTHATEGVAVIRNRCRDAESKTLFLHHPTKNRMPAQAANAQTTDTDLLIWGNISRYKGVAEFIRFANEHSLKLKIKVIGKCSSADLFEELKQQANPYISIENRSIRFDELSKEIQKTRYVLVPYATESVLSSGILMDSLSFGARVIGPNIGSFRDYANEPLLCVHTFDSFSEIAPIANHATRHANPDDYRLFLEKHSWKEFGKAFHYQLQKLTQQ